MSVAAGLRTLGRLDLHVTCLADAPSWLDIGASCVCHEGYANNVPLDTPQFGDQLLYCSVSLTPQAGALTGTVVGGMHCSDLSTTSAANGCSDNYAGCFVFVDKNGNGFYDAGTEAGLTAEVGANNAYSITVIEADGVDDSMAIIMDPAAASSTLDDKPQCQQYLMTRTSSTTMSLLTTVAYKIIDEEVRDCLWPCAALRPAIATLHCSSYGCVYN